MTTIRFKFFFAGIAGLLALTACAGERTPDATEIALAVETEIAARSATETEASHNLATQVAATLTAQPTATPTFTSTPTDTHTPTATATPTHTPTDTPTITSTPTKTATKAPTRPPVTLTFTPEPVSESVYGFTSGIDGYITDIECKRGSAPCTPIMPTGDINFEFVLFSFADTPWTLFEKYGLSVERDGVNIADMFMFVDAGYLPPDAGVWFGASRNFTVPGRYVIRSSGCLSTTPVPCGWNTMAGTMVIFTIQ